VSPRIPLPPAPVAQKDLPQSSGTFSKADLNNNNNNGSNDEDESNWDNDDEEKDCKVIQNKKGWDIVDAYFRRSRMDTLLAHAREAKTFGECIHAPIQRVYYYNTQSTYNMYRNMYSAVSKHHCSII